MTYERFKQIRALFATLIAVSYLYRRCNPMKRFILTTIVALALPSLALGIIDPIGFDPEGTLSGSGTKVTVSGAVPACEPKEKTVEIQVTILQESTLASARGTAQIPCEESENVSFVIETTVAEGKPAFQEGPAQACGLAIRRGGKKVAGLRFWCAYVDLVGQ